MAMSPIREKANRTGQSSKHPRMGHDFYEPSRGLRLVGGHNMKNKAGCAAKCDRGEPVIGRASADIQYAPLSLKVLASGVGYTLFSSFDERAVRYTASGNAANGMKMPALFVEPTAHKYFRRAVTGGKGDSRGTLSAGEPVLKRLHEVRRELNPFGGMPVAKIPCSLFFFLGSTTISRPGLGGCDPSARVEALSFLVSAGLVTVVKEIAAKWGMSGAVNQNYEPSQAEKGSNCYQGMRPPTSSAGRFERQRRYRMAAKTPVGRNDSGRGLARPREIRPPSDQFAPRKPASAGHSQGEIALAPVGQNRAAGVRPCYSPGNAVSDTYFSAKLAPPLRSLPLTHAVGTSSYQKRFLTAGYARIGAWLP